MEKWMYISDLYKFAQWIKAPLLNFVSSINPANPSITKYQTEIKTNVNLYFHTSLWSLKKVL